MTERSYRVLLWSLALMGLAVDQASKYGVFHWLAAVPGHTHVLWRLTPERGFQLRAQFYQGPDGRLEPHVNQGALFGFLGDHRELANAGFALVSLLAAVAILYWGSHKSTTRDPWLCAALGLILAGTLGNFYDRMIFGGVRDFLHWNYLIDWPIFNFADCCLVCGACLLLLQAFNSQSNPNPVHTEEPETRARSPMSCAATGPEH